MTSTERLKRAAYGAGLLLIGLSIAGAAVAETITVTHWGAAFYGAPYAVAMDRGFFQKHGADVTGVLTSTGGGTSVRNTLASDLPYGEVALPELQMHSSAFCLSSSLPQSLGSIWPVAI